MEAEKDKGLSLGGWVFTYGMTYLVLAALLAILLKEDVVDYLIRERLTLMTCTIAAVSLAITSTVDRILARDDEGGE